MQKVIDSYAEILRVARDLLDFVLFSPDADRHQLEQYIKPLRVLLYKLYVAKNE